MTNVVAKTPKPLIVPQIKPATTAITKVIDTWEIIAM
jgi:hypothetical protein